MSFFSAWLARSFRMSSRISLNSVKGFVICWLSGSGSYSNLGSNIDEGAKHTEPEEDFARETKIDITYDYLSTNSKFLHPT